jgi:vitamin B12 transporter
LFAPATIFGPVGNPALDAQTSQTWDVGIDQELFSGLVNAGVTYFQATYDDLIAWSPRGYGNVDNMESKGVETYVEYTPLDNLLLKLSYTYTDNDADGDTTEYFIPAHEVGLFINYAVTDKWNINLNGQYVDATDSSDSYTLLNAATTFQLTENLQIYGRLTNLLDEDYQLQRGYNEDRFGAYGGVKIDF